MNNSHYVYRIDDVETGQFYIGSRTCVGTPESDISYMGSMITWKPTIGKLAKTIISSDFSTRDDAMKLEISLITQYIDTPLNENYNIPGKGFHNTGRVFGEATRKKMSVSRMGNKNPRWRKPHSEETKEKIRKTATGRKLSEEVRMRFSAIRPKRPVIQYNKEMLRINEFISIAQAHRETKVDGGDIIRVCQGKQLSAGGYVWKYNQQ